MMNGIKNFTSSPFPEGVSIDRFFETHKNSCIIMSTGKASPSAGLGEYHSVLYYNGFIRHLRQGGLKTTNPSYPFVQGLLDAARLIKRPCPVIILTASDAGFGDPESPNKIYCEMILKALLGAGCSVTITVASGKSGELARFMETKI